MISISTDNSYQQTCFVLFLYPAHLCGFYVSLSVKLMITNVICFVDEEQQHCKGVTKDQSMACSVITEDRVEIDGLPSITAYSFRA